MIKEDVQSRSSRFGFLFYLLCSMTPVGCGFEEFCLWAGLFIWVSATKKGKFRILRKLRTRCKLFIEVRTAGVCFPHKAKDLGAFRLSVRMETHCEFNNNIYFTVFFSIFCHTLFLWNGYCSWSECRWLVGRREGRQDSHFSSKAESEATTLFIDNIYT